MIKFGVIGKNIIGDAMSFLKKESLSVALSGLAIGFVNGLFGAGGGMLAVPLLRHAGLEQKQAHANAVSVILPITLLSAVLYAVKGYVTVSDALIYIPGGIAGSVTGSLLLKKISPALLKRAFGFFMLYAGVRLLLR